MDARSSSSSADTSACLLLPPLPASAAADPSRRCRGPPSPAAHASGCATPRDDVGGRARALAGLGRVPLALPGARESNPVRAVLRSARVLVCVVVIGGSSYTCK